LLLTYLHVVAYRVFKFAEIYEFYQFCKFVIIRKNSFPCILMNAVLNVYSASFKFAFCA